MTEKRGWLWISIGLICLLIVSSSFGAYYYMECLKYKQLYNESLTELQKYSKYMLVNILIDFGNGTKEWHNNTLVARGADVLNATRIVAEVNYIRGQYGAFVTHIRGVGGDPNTYWLWYVWNSTSARWDFGPIACDAYVLHEGEVVAWIYSKF